MKLKTIIWFSLLLIMLVGGCQIFSPPNVETVVKEDYLRYWHLSPNRDYLVYGTSKGDFLLDLVTNKKLEFDCDLLWWDNYYVGCHNPLDVSMIDAKTMLEIPLTPIDLNKKFNRNTSQQAKELFINQLLAKSEMIYRPEWTTDTVYILSPNYLVNLEENYFVSGLTQPVELLANYTVITVTVYLPIDRRNEKVPSPNGLYYYDFITDGFAIYDTNNQVVSQYVEEHVRMLDILGWAPDSSGVYFVSERAGMTIVGPEAVRKLTIPDE